MRWFRKHPILVLLIVITLIPVTSFGLWYLKPTRKLNVFLMDKTVPTHERYEHKSFNWVLNQSKFVKEDGYLYKPNIDYYGFFPINTEQKKFDFRRVRVREVDQISDTYDLAYFADTYGVFYNEWYQKRENLGQSQRIFGGLNNNDYLLMSKFINKQKLVISEFNLFASPTNKLVRKKTEKLLDIYWTGWTGRYYPRLDTLNNKDLPKWLIHLYKKDNNNKWPFTESGIIFVKNNKVVVLENNTHLNKEVPFIYPKKEITDQFQLADSVHYTFWFDITKAGKSNETIASYKLDVNKMGQKLLSKHKIPQNFPAVIRQKDSKLTYYFCGDYADNKVWYPSCYFENVHKISRLFYSKELSQRKMFFWTFYRPLMKGILEDYYNNKVVLQIPETPAQ